MELQMKNIRTRLKMGQREVAAKAGMELRRYGSYERGERKLSLEDAAMIADVFGCSLDELAGREWPPGGPGAPLAPDEREVVDSYRRTAEDDKPAFIQTARTYAYAGDAKKEELSQIPEVVGRDIAEL